MKFTIRTCYRVEFLPLAVSFVGECARCLGATEKEAFELGMAAEEAGLHIIEHFPGDGLNEQFEICCEVHANSLHVTLSNMGLPVNPQALPQYEISQPEKTADGLGLYLLSKLVDHYEFVNQGRAGWRTVIHKRLSQLRVPTAQSAGTASGASAYDKLQVIQAGIEHVPGIVELAYRTYGYSYSKDLFYYADQLAAAIAGGQVKSFIAITEDGQVVGQIALLYAPASRDLAEVGSLMIRPECRSGMSIRQLLRTVSDTVTSSTAAPALIEANLVTTHVLSQKACRLFNFKSMAFKLSIHGRARFVRLADASDGQRESLLYALTRMHPIDTVRLYAPSSHVEMTRKLFANAEVPFELRCDSPSVPEQTELTTEAHAESEWAAITVAVPGQDCAAVLRTRLFELESDGVKTVQIRFPGWRPQPPSLDREANALRIFFSGWIAESPDRWWLTYTRLIAQRFNFAGIQLCDPQALELRAYVESCYREVIL